ncbi:hypothetical protein [Lacticaseibacillus songhuajiangensis]|jgi:hypothetical protein|uniref:hypothetical protein n=1 Tax=Lacticaseibacillus songhuajiangensis TaxID=1296539 RepID=UPI000F7719BA|nr:hypothetical protein [Lacticaseibacillus songhuajiangensis]
MLIVAAIRKAPKKTSLIVLIAGIVLAVVGLGGEAIVENGQADYTVTTKAEGKTFIGDATTDQVKGKTLEFKVTDTGDMNSQVAVGLKAPGGFTVKLPVSKSARQIKVGDTVRVTCTSVGSLFGYPIISATLEK